MSGYADIDTLARRIANLASDSPDPVGDAALSRVRELAEAAERVNDIPTIPSAPFYEALDDLRAALRAVREGTGE